MIAFHDGILPGSGHWLLVMILPVSKGAWINSQFESRSELMPLLSARSLPLVLFRWFDAGSALFPGCHSA